MFFVPVNNMFCVGFSKPEGCCKFNKKGDALSNAETQVNVLYVIVIIIFSLPVGLLKLLQYIHEFRPVARQFYVFSRFVFLPLKN
jgi:hypothetical protein